MIRKTILKTGHYYHVLNKSISKFVIFNTDEEFKRMIQAMVYYQTAQRNCSLSNFLRSAPKRQNDFLAYLSERSSWLVEIAAFCIMPTHFHFLLKQSREDGISIFISNLSNSYARYFNKKHARKGPLWVGNFKAVLVETDEQLQHLSRYIHLNPTTSGLVQKPELWKYSSYVETIGLQTPKLTIGVKSLDFTPEQYKKFVESHISAQKELAIIKHLMIE